MTDFDKNKIGNQAKPIAEKGGVQADGVQVSPDELKDADPDAPVVPPDLELPVAKRQPVLVAFAVAALPVIATFVLQILTLADVAVPLWIRTALLGIGGLIGTVAALWARANVTPVADPKLDADIPLVPAPLVNTVE